MRPKQQDLASDDIDRLLDGQDAVVKGWGQPFRDPEFEFSEKQPVDF